MSEPLNEDESLRRYGLRPSAGDLDEIRDMLREQTALRQDAQDIELMKLGCVQLFNAGELTDVLAIWRAKESSWDAHCSIDVQLLCGAGLDATKAYLAADRTADASDALQYLVDCEAAGDFTDFSVAERSRMYGTYYAG